MEIQEALSELNTFSELLEIAKRSESRLSFWGKEYVVIVGYEGNLSVDDIAKKTMFLFEQKPEFSESDRLIGKDIEILINQMYKSFEPLRTKANILTRIFCVIGDFFHLLRYGGYDTQDRWLRWYSRTLECYTTNQFIKVFSKDPRLCFPTWARLDPNCQQWPHLNKAQ